MDLKDHPVRRARRASVARSGRRDLAASAGSPDLRGRRGLAVKVDRSDRPACRGVMLSASAVRWDPKDREESRVRPASAARAVSVAQWASPDHVVPKARKDQQAPRVREEFRAPQDRQGLRVPEVRRAAMVRLGHEDQQDPRSTTTPSSTC